MTSPALSDIRTLRAQYPALGRMTYLDTATCGLIATTSVEAARLQQEGLMNGGSAAYAYWHNQGGLDLRRIIAADLNGPIEGTALTTGFSGSAAQLAPMLSHRKKVLALKGDYPTLIGPFKHRPFEMVEIAPVDGGISLELLDKALETHEPDIFLIGHVQWRTGVCADLKGVADLCKAHGAVSVVDATQSWCSVPIDVRGSGVDIIGASGYKWPLAGFGNGFMFLSDSVRAEITEHWRVDPVTRLNSGHRDPVSLVRLQDALTRVDQIGKAAITSHVRSVCDHFIATCDERGIEVLSGREPERRAGIIMVKGGHTEVDQLMTKNIHVAFRGAGIRVGIHFYNTTEEVDLLLAAMR